MCVWVVGDATIKGSEKEHLLKQALYFKEIGFNLHDTMIYSKKVGVPRKFNRYYPAFLNICLFLVKEKPKTHNLIQDRKIFTCATLDRLKLRKTIGRNIKTIILLW